MAAVCDGNVTSAAATNESLLEAWLLVQKYPVQLVDRALTPLWYIVGIAGNIVSAAIWLRRRMRRNNSSAVYLATLSINDTLFLLLHIIQWLNYAWKIRTVDNPVACEIFAYMFLVTQYLAPILVLGFTVERYIAVCFPFLKSQFCTASRALKVSLSMIVGCLLLASMQLYLWTYDSDSKTCVVLKRARDSSLFDIWTWTTEMLMFLAVPVFILVVNILVMREVCRMSNATVETAISQSRLSPSKSAATNAMLLSVSFYVIFTTLPATLVYALATAFPGGHPQSSVSCYNGSVTGWTLDLDPDWQRYIVYYTVRKIVDEVCMSHYACNFFLFVITGSEFRLELRRTVQRVFGGRSTSSTGQLQQQHNGAAFSELANSSRYCRNSLRSTDESHTFVTKV